MMMRWMALGLLVAGVAACAGAGDEGAGHLGVAVRPLTDSCSGLPGNEALSRVARVEVSVTGPDRADAKVIDRLATGGSKVDAGNAVVNLGGVPAGPDRVVTLLGYEDGAENPSWFGRRRDVTVNTNKVASVDMTLARLGAFTCLTPPGSMTNRAFAATVRLGDGRVLITGGFETATSTSTSMELTGPSSRAFLYDPSKGTMTETRVPMTTPRAGHAMVAVPLPTGEKVLIFGGVNKARLNLNPAGDVAFFADTAADGLNSYETFEIRKCDDALIAEGRCSAADKATGVTVELFAPAGNDADNNPKQLSLKRGFLSAVRLYDNSVLITGGGKWPLDQSAYQKADVWAPWVDEPRGGIVPVKYSPTSSGQHNGAALVKVEDTPQGLSRYLVIGGTPELYDGKNPRVMNIVEIFNQSSKQSENASSAFKALDVKDQLESLYFPSAVRLPDDLDGSKRFLVAGGLPYEAGLKLGKPKGKAWILTLKTVGSTDTLSVQSLDAPCAARFLGMAIPSFECENTGRDVGDVSCVVTFVGGYKDFAGTANADTCFFVLNRRQVKIDGVVRTLEEAPYFQALEPGQEPFLPRAAMAGGRMVDDTLLLVGGLQSPQSLAQAAPALLEVYVPPLVRTELQTPEPQAQ